jgi:hypothetical protein
MESGDCSVMPDGEERDTAILCRFRYRLAELGEV